MVQATSHLRPALVTGSARGIGRVVAERLLAGGSSVALLDRDPSVIDVAAQLGDRCIGRVVDVSDADAAGAAVDDVAAAFGGLWAVVNNAGVFAKSLLLDIDIADWDVVMGTNARSMLVVMQSAAPHLIRGGGGRIINQSSMAAKLGTPGEALYAASKAAVGALTRIAAIELGPHGITVNSICPGYVLTDMGADTRDAAQIAEWTAKSPLGRLATPADVAGAIEFLVSDDASYITGEALNVSGGMCVW